MGLDNTSQFLFHSTKSSDPGIRSAKKWPWVIAGLALVVALVLVYWLVMKFWNNDNKVVVSPPNPMASSSLVNLGDVLASDVNRPQSGVSKGEAVYFGNFYQSLALDSEVKAPSVSLPINIKDDTANYYYINREISLSEAQLNAINQNGFVVIDNPFVKEADDFFSVYKTLNEKNLPFILTNDFYIYYYQNTVKSIFKQLETEAFYQATWDFNKAMYELSSKRYLERYNKVGLANDTVLEAMRMQTAFFAVSLELLKVKPGQFTKGEVSNVPPSNWLKEKFSSDEADYYSFSTPSYIKLEVEKELANIKRAKKTEAETLSPVMLYDMEYERFVVPKEYEKNHRLGNFYVTWKWLNTVFPLYYRSTECLDCLLDKSDWLISQTAAHLIARDISTNQEIKNDWAKIYKVLAYFSGLRNDLTYLDYNNALTNKFGVADLNNPEAVSNIENIFANNNEARDANATLLQQELASYKFDIARGAYDRSLISNRNKIGFRLSQEYYWPTEYIFDQLIYDRAGVYLGDVRKLKKDVDKTACALTQSSAVRCRALVWDIANAVYDEKISTEAFVRNTWYKSYADQVPVLRRYFNNMDNNAWHVNFFWSNLQISKYLLNNRKIDRFNYTLTNDWSNVVLDTSAGALVNTALPYDQWRYYNRQSTGLSDQDILQYNYLEPNLALINELIANARMVFKSLIELGMVRENHAELTGLISELETMKRIIVKERQGELSDFNDWFFIDNLASKYYVAESGAKSVTINFADPKNASKPAVMEQMLGGVKLLLSVQNHQGKNIIVSGPIFNFSERAR